jgi:hypothetical protein
MLHFVARSLMSCAFVAGLVVVQPASARLPVHLPQFTVGPDVGADPETAEEPQFGRTVLIRDELGFVG